MSIFEIENEHFIFKQIITKLKYDNDDLEREVEEYRVHIHYFDVILLGKWQTNKLKVILQNPFHSDIVYEYPRNVYENFQKGISYSTGDIPLLA